MTAENVAWAITGALGAHVVWESVAALLTFWKAGRR